MKQFYLSRLKSTVFIVVALFGLFSNHKVKAQTTLAAGDLVFTGFNSLGSAASSTSDTFTFVLLKAISAGTTIGFSDRGYSTGTTTWYPSGTTEGSIVWTCNSALPMGTNLIMMGANLYVYNSATGATTINGSVAVTEGTLPVGLVLGTAADQVIAFQSSNGSIQGSTLIAGIHFYNCMSTTTAATWDVCSGTAVQRSVIPAGLTNGFSAFYTGQAASQARYQCPSVVPTTATDIRNSVMTLSNWTIGTSQTASTIPMISGCGFIAAAPTVSAPSDATKCNGSSASFAVVSAGSNSYQWQISTDGGSSYGSVPNNAPYSNITSDTLKISAVTSAMNSYKYRCVVTNSTGPTTSAAATLTVTTVTASISSQTNVSCNGGTNGSATVTAGGGTLPYDYSWSPSGGTAATATGLSAQVYTITVHDGNGCTKIITDTIKQPNALTASITAQTNVSCNGGTNGSATVTAGGGTLPYDYSWSPSGGTAATATGLSAQVYTITVHDGNGCTKIITDTIKQPNALTASITAQTNVSCNGGTNGSATVTAGGGTLPYDYSWSPSGGTAATATGLSAQVYTITVHDGNGCTKIITDTIKQPNALTASITAQTNVSCNGGTNGSATVTAGGGTLPYDYSWSPSGGTAATATGLSAQVYTITVHDGNGCTKIITDTIKQPNALTASITAQTNVSCNGGTNGSATVTAGGGTIPYDYSWSPSGGTAATATGLSAQVYTITVHDGNGCTKIITDTIKQPNALTASITAQTNVSCNGGTNGSATVTAGGGTLPYDYSWSPSGGTAATATGLSAQVYTITVHDGNGCTKIITDTIKQPNALTASITAQTNVSCNGGTNGSATVTAGGGTIPYDYSWSPSGGTAATATGLSAQVYTITVHDGNGCTKIITDTIKQPNALTASITAQTNVSCNGGTNGSATVTAGGGTLPYDYSWSPSGGTAATATGLSAQVYTITVHDGNGCTKIITDTIKQPNALTAISSQTNVSCNGGANGSATVTIGGGTLPYNYSWSPSGGTGATATGLSAQVYTVTVHDGNGCAKNVTDTIRQPATAVQVVAINDTNSCSGTNVTLGATASGGTPSYTYNWTPGNLSGANPVVNPTTTTSYIVTATDANGCTKKDTVVVSVGGVLAQANQANSVSIEGADTSTANVLIGNLNFCYNEDCKIIASVKNNPALGAITAYVTVEDSVPTLNGRPYLSRWYKITPTNNIAASVNLYFTQQDFDEYNTYAGAHGYPLLPQNPTDLSGIDTLVISKVSGGDLNSGNGIFTLIHPDSVKWNATLHFWTVSLQVPSFSEFFVHAGNSTNTPLIVSLSSFTAKKENNTVGLYWTTLSETESVGFSIERSSDGKRFDAIGNVNSLAKNGNSNVELDYNFVDKAPFIGMNYYRLAEINKAGVKVYSDVRTVNFDSKSVFNCYPNPTTGQIAIEHTSGSDGTLTVRLTDVLGKVVLETKMPVIKGFNKTQVNVSSLAQGMYNMSIVGADGVLYNTRITKQ